MTLAGILGAALAPDKGLATLPIAAMVVGTAIASLPASFLMRKIGRRAGFVIGAGIGVAGSAVAAVGLQSQSFILFGIGHLLIGAWQGFGNYYRFAAVEVAGPKQASRAISWVVGGGIVAAFAGPQIGVWARDWFPPHAFLGSFAAQTVLALAAMGLLSRLRAPPASTLTDSVARPLRVIVAQPALAAAIFGAASGYVVMIMAMTATPLAMLGCGFGTGEVKPVIQWHVFGMFAPSFFTGALVARYGALRVCRSVCAAAGASCGGRLRRGVLALPLRAGAAGRRLELCLRRGHRAAYAVLPTCRADQSAGAERVSHLQPGGDRQPGRGLAL
jgi:MFS family permease